MNEQTSFELLFEMILKNELDNFINHLKEKQHYERKEYLTLKEVSSMTGDWNIYITTINLCSCQAPSIG